MSYQPVFGAGGVIYPAQQTLVEIDLTANTTIAWPTEQQIGGANIAAAIIDVVATAGPWAITLGDARVVSNGYAILFHNLGANTFSVRDQGLNTLLTVASGEAWVLYLRDNATANGAWEVFEQGAGTSTANAASLVGAGIKAITTTLNQKMNVDDHAVNYVILDADRARLLKWTGGVGDFTLPDASTVGEDWFCALKNSGSGSVVVTPAAGTIDGLGSITLALAESTFVVSDGVNWFTVGFGQEVNSVFDFVSIDVSGTGNYTLTGAELNRVSYQLTGLLTGNRTIIVPATTQQYWVDNNTTGAFSLTVKTAAGAGATVAQGSRNILYCDGTDVISAVTFDAQTFADGSAAAPSITFTSSSATGLFNVAGVLGVATGGVQRGSVDTIGGWILAAPSSGTAPTLTVTGRNAQVGSLTVTSPFNLAAATPGLVVTSTAVGGFATVSICADSNTPGTDDLSIFQNGSTNDVTIINRAADAQMTLETTGGAAAQMNFVPGGVNVMQLRDNTSQNVVIGVTANSNSIGFRSASQTTVGAAGGASALPATPLGYLTVNINGSNVVFPYYLAS